MIQDKVRVAVIGTGWWATATHIPALITDSAVDLVALCDTDPLRVSAAAAAFGVTHTYDDPNALLVAEQPDAVVVATTHATHFAVALACLKAGAHILIEKPMTLHASEARILTEQAAAINRAIVMGYPWNYHAHARQLRERLASGSFGPIQCVQSVFNSYNADLIGGRDRSEHPGGYPVHGPGDVYSKKEHSGGGHGHLQMTHAAGLLFYVTGLKPKRVQARMANHDLPLDLVDIILVEFEGGALGTVSGTSNAFLSRSALSLGCAQGGIELDLFAGTAALREGHGEQETLPPVLQPDLSLAPVRNLIAIACGTETSDNAAEVGWRAVELLEAAYRSAESDGRPVEIAELYPNPAKSL